MDYDFTNETGLTNLDYLNGQIVPLDDGSKQLYTGISSGRAIMCIGKSGTGKSTMAMQIAYNIASRYENGLVYIYDFEQNNTKDRFRGVTGSSEEWFKEHCMILREGISTEAVLRTLSKIKELKLKNEKEILVPNENGIKDENGEIVKVLPPSVVIIDSLAMMMPENLLAEEEVGGSMAATAVAKTNTAFFKRAIQLCNRANIILIMVNHITQQIAIGVTPPSAQVNYLKQDEAIS